MLVATCKLAKLSNKLSAHGLANLSLRVARDFLVLSRVLQIPHLSDVGHHFHRMFLTVAQPISPSGPRKFSALFVMAEPSPQGQLWQTVDQI